MATPKYTSVGLIKRKGYYDVIVYYSRNGEKFRPLTGVTVLPKHVTRSGEISSTHPSYEQDLKKIAAVQNQVEDLVTKYVDKYGEKPAKSWLVSEFTKPKVQARKDLKDALGYWAEFILHKQQTVRSNATIGRLNNLKTTIDKFKKVKNYEVSFKLLDQSFFNDLVHYMVYEHKHVKRSMKDKAEQEVDVPVIGLNNDVAVKRLKDFVDYLKYCVVEQDVDIKLEKIKSYIKVAKHKAEVRPIGRTSKWELTLTPEEIQFVVNLDQHEREYWESLSGNRKRYLHIFTFMCLQGTSPVDTQGIHKPDIQHGKIVKDRSKSGEEFKVELDPISEEILELYDYNLKFTEQSMNDELKSLFVTIFELYRKHYENKYGEPYQMICTQRTKKGNEYVTRVAHRGLFVENTTGRRSFLTNLEEIKELGIKEKMAKAGHASFDTTLGYHHERQQNKKTKGSLFGITRMPVKKK